MPSKYRARRERERRAPLAVAPITLGCPKNIVDTERMLGILREGGYRIVGDLSDADCVLINTCGFLESARDESGRVIREMAELKRAGEIEAIVVAGCMVEHEGLPIARSFPEVDGWLGVLARPRVIDVVDRALGVDRKKTPVEGSVKGASSTIIIPKSVPHPMDDEDRIRVTARHVAYLKIAEGCNRRCSFCAIPNIRGPFGSKPISQIVAEARSLAADGVKELILVAQETSYYGMDTDGVPRLTELLEALEEIDGIAWIRVMYTYPQFLDERLAKCIAQSRKVLPYIDIPLQHCNDEILKNMRRQVDRKSTEKLLEVLRDGIPNLVLRTSMIVGFPGETDQMFQELVAFVERWRFERLGVFEFSPERSTPAAKLEGRVPEDVARARHGELLAAQQKIAFDWNARQVGATHQVLIDRYMPMTEDALEAEAQAPDAGEQAVWIGRTFADAPEIDGAVYVTGQGLRPGDLVDCEILETSGYDLAGYVHRNK